VRTHVPLLACIVGAGLVSGQPSYALAGQPLSAPTPSKPGLGGPVAPPPDSPGNTLLQWQRGVIARLFSLHYLPSKISAVTTADVMFAVDQEGHIIYYKIIRSSDDPTLDRAVRTLMAHADPLPPPPPFHSDPPGSPLSFVITIGYYSKPD
jgi:TonB family protein